MSGAPYQFELLRPLWLLGLAALPVVVFYFYRGLVDFARWQRVLSMTARALIVGLLVLALAGLTLLTPTKRQYVIFALDKSKSVGEESRKAADAFVAQAIKSKGKNEFAVFQFGAAPGPVRQGEALPPPAPIDDNATNLAAALEMAAAATPPFFVPKIVLLSDGNQTAGDALKAALRAKFPISTVPLASRTDPEVQVSAVNVPAQVQQGEAFRVEVVVDSNAESEGTIEVYRNDHKIASDRRKLKKGENRFTPPVQSIEQGGMTRYTVMARGFKDTLLDNNSDFGLVYTSGKPRILLIEGDSKSSRDLVWALEQHEMQVDVRPATGMPDSLAELQNYELLMLSNVPATALSMKQMEVARTFVQDLGGGLIMLGGDQSFGLGGYYKTVLEEILPVRSDFEKEKEKPSLAMVLVIDKSGSMGGEKIELAKDAAKSAIELLGNSDKIGVIAFDGEAFWICDVHPASDKGYVLDRVSSIDAGGGTNMYPAMEEAFDALTRTQAKLKHVIILTDGISAPGDFEGIAGSMAQARITVSTVGVGEGCDQNLLEEIARIGNGRYYFTDDPLSVPQIFAKETVAASKSAINEQPFMAQMVRPTQTLNEIDFESSPFLLGYVITRRKPTSEMILATETGDPLLVWWRYGLGMSVAFSSDAKARWAADWLTWPQFSKFWAQVVRHAMRKADAKGVSLQVAQSDRKASVTLDSIEPSGKFLNNAQTELTVIDPQLGKSKLEMVQVAPGRYQAEFQTPHEGAYQLDFAQKLRGNLLYHQSRGFAVGYADEVRLRPTNEDLLRTIASASGGRFSPKPEDVFAPADRTARRALPLWPYLVLAAALLFVADVALRRVDFTLLGGRLSARRAA